MSLERAYKNCIDCTNWYELHAGDEVLSNIEVHNIAMHINQVMNEAMKALEEERQHSAAHSSDSQANEYKLAETALTACVKCDKRNAAIADLLEKEMPEIFNTGETEEQK